MFQVRAWIHSTRKAEFYPLLEFLAVLDFTFEATIRFVFGATSTSRAFFVFPEICPTEAAI